MRAHRYDNKGQLIEETGLSGSLPSLTSPKVLVAEDQPEMRHLLGKWLREVGYDVVELPDGASLWDQIVNWQTDEDNPRDPDLIISDIRMPGQSGLEVLERLRASDWATPVILMTAFGDLETHLSASRLGATRVFDKPFDMKELVATALSLVDPKN